MAIHKLKVSNFKSIKNLELDCKRINVFIGEPNTGKSNILETIGLLSSINYNKLDNFVRFESMLDLFYDRNIIDPIKIEFDNTILTVTFKEGRFVADVIEYNKDEDASSGVVSYDYDGNQTRYLEYSLNRGKYNFAQFKYYRFKKLEAFSNKTSDYLLPSDGENLLHIILTRKDLKSIISNLFKKFGYRVVFKPSEGKIEIQKEQDDVIVSIPYALSSETLQRMSFYLAAIHSNKDSVISFEEPEAHAFPYYMKYLAEKVAIDKANNQYFIATHNPYFLMSILEKAQKKEIATFATYFEDYQTKVKALSSEETENALSMGADVFFNIDQFLKREECAGN